MRALFRPALVMLVALTVITGIIYPLIVTCIATTLFAHKATGSIITRDGATIGSELIGQSFTDGKYFWPRPSATSPVPYAADAGAGSNLAPSNPALAEAVKQRVAALRAADPGNEAAAPVELITASASGLDPHISVAAAEYQIGRVARNRGLPPELVARRVHELTEPRTMGILGEPRVNVLKLNLALDDR